MNVILKSLGNSDKEQFVLDNQEAFNFGALEEFGLRDSHFEEGEQIISKATIEKSIAEGEAYRIIADENIVGGLVVRVSEDKGELDLLFIKPSWHSKGIGQKAWFLIEKMYPQVKIWETVTPYFEKRNIHFYVNRLGFHIVEYFNKFHPDPNEVQSDKNTNDDNGFDGMFKFQKIIIQK